MHSSSRRSNRRRHAPQYRREYARPGNFRGSGVCGKARARPEPARGMNSNMSSDQRSRGASATLALVAPARASAVEPGRPGGRATSRRGDRRLDRAAGAPSPAAARDRRCARGIAELRSERPGRFAAPELASPTPRSAVPTTRATRGQPGGWATTQWNFLPWRPGTAIRVARAWASTLAEPGDTAAAAARRHRRRRSTPGVAYRDSAPASRRSPDFAPTSSSPGYRLRRRRRAAARRKRPRHPRRRHDRRAGDLASRRRCPTTSTGIAYGAKLMPVRVLDAHGRREHRRRRRRGSAWAAKQRRRRDQHVASTSTRPSTSCRQVPTVCAAIRKADALGALVVGAAGNALDRQRQAPRLFPAGAPHAFARRRDHRATAASRPTPTTASAPTCSPRAAAQPRPARLAARAARTTRDRSSSSPTACFPMDCAEDARQFAIRPTSAPRCRPRTRAASRRW